jgi:hypothetical protein
MLFGISVPDILELKAWYILQVLYDSTANRYGDYGKLTPLI